jgi:hypothetical protein
VKLNPAAVQTASGAFSFKMPSYNNYLNLPGRTNGRMAVYGDGTILRPLSPGTHTLVQLERFAGFSSEKKTTYKLTVG